MPRIGILTGGGDCPGLNPAIRAVVRRSFQLGNEVFAVYEGFRGLATGAIEPFDIKKSSGILHVGGTILKSSRFNPFKAPESIQQIRENLKLHQLDGLIVIGGEGTLRLALEFSKRFKIPVIGIPKTIDNDVWGTDLTLGFLTAVETATDALDKLHTTAESHNVVMILEVMGRHTGWIGLYAGLAGGADVILVPEKKMKLSSILSVIQKRRAKGKNFSLVVISEDAHIVDDKGRDLVSTPTKKDEYGHVKLSGVGELFAQLIQKRTKIQSRVVVLGHIQRGGSPCAQDRILATQFGVLAAELAFKNKWNRMTAIKNGKIISIPLKSVTNKIKQADMKLYQLAERFFG